MRRQTIAALALCAVLCTAAPYSALADTPSSAGQGPECTSTAKITVSTSKPQDGISQIDDGLMTYRIKIKDGSQVTSLSLEFTGYITGSYDGPEVADYCRPPYIHVSVEPGATVLLRTEEGRDPADYALHIRSGTGSGFSASAPAGKALTFTEKDIYYLTVYTKDGDELCEFDTGVFSRPPQEVLPKTASPLTSFVDVPSGAWYEGEVAEAEELGVISGTGANHLGQKFFRPENTLTVGEAITLAAKTRAQYEGDTIPPGPEGYTWEMIYMDYSRMKGVIKKEDFGYLDRPVTRGEMANFFSHTMPEAEYQLVYKAELPVAPDVGASPYKADIDRLYRCHIVSGSDSQGNFRPESTITRAEAAAIINRVSRLTGARDSSK